MKTVVFVDGYNLYYGCLKNTNYKWLDLSAMMKHIVREAVPSSEVIFCQFYTAMIKARVAGHGDDSVIAQQIYHKALESIHTDPVEIIKSTHVLEPDRPMSYLGPGTNPDKNYRVDAWKLEEKQTDVRIALDAFELAIGGDVEQIVVCSNDTDLIPLFEAIRRRAPAIHVGLIAPRREKNDKSGRPAAKALTKLAHWSRTVITEAELQQYQFPDRVPTKKRPADRPKHW